MTGETKPYVCLIDADVLRYEVGFGVEWTDEAGEHRINSFESASDLLQEKLRAITEMVETTQPPILFLTGDTTTCEIYNRNAKRFGLPPKPYVPNYREAVAASRGYKDNRAGEKPFHYKNLTAHILGNYDVRVAVGYEADDLISITANTWQDEGTTPIICSRDKDLKITPGWHYSWPCGGQPQFGPTLIDKIGFLEMRGSKLIGGGLKFFYAQMIMGDKTDNIPGLPRGGPVLAYKTLAHLETEEEMRDAVLELYKQRIENSWEEYAKEQAALLWVCQEWDDNGEPKRKVWE